MMYRVVVDLFQPHVLLIVWMGLALVQIGRKGIPPRRRLIWLLLPLFGLLAITTPLISFLALGTLEWSYPPLESRPSDVQAVVVLSGDLRPADGIRRKPELGVDTLYRCLRAAEVYQDGDACLIVVSGGVRDPGNGAPAAAEVMRDFLVRVGVRARDVVVETESRTTDENAVYSGKLLEARGIRKIVLVTDAAHLMRAAACFQRQGLEVVPCGCRYRATRLPASLETVLPDPSSARGFRDAWHEWTGFAWYWLTGRI